MKRTITTLTIVLALLFSFTTMAHAWGSASNVFKKNVDRAMKKEKRGNVEDAREYWAKVAEAGEELLVDNPDKSAYYLGTARAHYATGNYDRAAELYDGLFACCDRMGITDKGKKFAWAYVYYGLTQAKLGNKDKAIAAWQQVPQTAGKIYATIQEQIAALGGEVEAQ